MMWCKICGAEYIEGVRVCQTCEVELVDHEPTRAQLGEAHAQGKRDIKRQLRLESDRGKECPECGVTLPESEGPCDCGYEFNLTEQQHSTPSTLGAKYPTPATGSPVSLVAQRVLFVGTKLWNINLSPEAAVFQPEMSGDQVYVSRYEVDHIAFHMPGRILLTHHAEQCEFMLDKTSLQAMRAWVMGCPFMEDELLQLGQVWLREQTGWEVRMRDGSARMVEGVKSIREMIISGLADSDTHIRRILPPIHENSSEPEKKLYESLTSWKTIGESFGKTERVIKALDQLGRTYVWHGAIIGGIAVAALAFVIGLIGRGLQGDWNISAAIVLGLVLSTVFDSCTRALLKRCGVQGAAGCQPRFIAQLGGWAIAYIPFEDAFNKNFAVFGGVVAGFLTGTLASGLLVGCPIGALIGRIVFLSRRSSLPVAPLGES